MNPLVILSFSSHINVISCVLNFAMAPGVEKDEKELNLLVEAGQKVYITC